MQDLKREIQVMRTEFRKTPAEPLKGRWEDMKPRGTRDPNKMSEVIC